MRFICDNIGVNEAGRLTFAGMDTTELAKEFGTPLYLMDEARLRANCRVYTEAFRSLPAGSVPMFAGKANAFGRMFRLAEEEGLGIDTVSAGEIWTAKTAGCDMSRICFHGNGKTDEDIALAMDCGVGTFVIDGVDELLAVEAEAARRGIRQKALLRLTPGIDTHTYAAVNTGLVDSKFGVAIETGQAAEFVKLALRQPHILTEGYHCHVGSQVFEEDVFERAALVMLEFCADTEKKTGFACRVLDLGGGYGVRYVDSDPYVDIGGKIASVAATVRAACARLGLAEPAILMEPGRSIVADAGMTLYKTVAVKRIPGYKNYVTIDGGMADNPRYALYGSKYTCLYAEGPEAEAEMVCTLAGRCCESGDLIQENVRMPESIRRGDVVAVCTTGAYNYSMASNYNRLPRPPIVLLSDGKAELAVRRESLAGLVESDL